MKKSIFGQGLTVFLMVTGIFIVIGVIGDAKQPKCIQPGCNHSRTSDSSYCYRHKPDVGKQSTHSSTSSQNNTSSNSGASTTNTPSGSNTNSTGTTSGNNSSNHNSNTTNGSHHYYNSYDDGYDDIYMDGDYDYDRYENDSDYADGVDDAMEEFEEDW